MIIFLNFGKMVTSIKFESFFFIFHKSLNRRRSQSFSMAVTDIDHSVSSQANETINSIRRILIMPSKITHSVFHFDRNIAYVTLDFCSFFIMHVYVYVYYFFLLSCAPNCDSYQFIYSPQTFVLLSLLCCHACCRHAFSTYEHRALWFSLFFLLLVSAHKMMFAKEMENYTLSSTPHVVVYLFFFSSYFEFLSFCLAFACFVRI